MYPRWLWPGFALPGVLWLIILFVVPFYAVIGVAFGTIDPNLLSAVPIWNPYNWNVGWVNLLAPDGYVNRFLQFAHIIDQPYGWLDGQPNTVIMALVSGYIPSLILPLYASLDRIDKSQLEAARDLGASPFRAFLHVTLPLSKTGILGGSVLIALPMFGDYYTPNLVSGAPTTSMLGNQIDLYFHYTSQPTIGAALTIMLSLFLVVLMAYYMITIARATKELESL